MRKASAKTSPASTAAGKCFVCDSNVVNDLELGEFHKSGKIAVHYFCLLLTSGLVQNGDDEQGLFGFLHKDIRGEVERIKRLKCCYCRTWKANIGCCVAKCRRTFHTNCGVQNGCLMQFEDPYRSYCHEHITQGTGTDGRGARNNRHAAEEMCTICYDQMGAFDTIQSVLSPCCKKSWFHKRCLMQFAKNAGYFFKCPMCNNEDDFREAVKLRGVFVPDRDAAWELEPNAFAELLERPERCEAATCRCPQGRDSECSKYKLMHCDTCGSHCVHNRCMPAANERFVCADCEVPAAAAVEVEEEVGAAQVDDNDDDDDRTDDGGSDVDVTGPGKLRVSIETDDKCNSDIDDELISLRPSKKRPTLIESESSGDDSDNECLLALRMKKLHSRIESNSSGGDINASVDVAPATSKTGVDDSDDKDKNIPPENSNLPVDNAQTTPTSTSTSASAPAPLTATNSMDDVIIVETPHQDASIVTLSSDDDEHHGNRQSDGSAKKRRPVKRERLPESENSDARPPQSKKIRRALQTMKNQSKITSFFGVLSADAHRTVRPTASAPSASTSESSSTPPVGPAARIKPEPV